MIDSEIGTSCIFITPQWVPNMKIKFAVAALIAALTLAACAKQEATAPVAPAAESSSAPAAEPAAPPAAETPAAPTAESSSAPAAK